MSDKNEKKFLLSRNLVVRLIRVAWDTKLHLHRTISAEGYDISPDHMMVLGFLWKIDGISQSEISNYTGKSKSNVTRILDKLSDKGLVYRQVDKDDRRSYKIFLTEKGRDLREEIYPIIENVLSNAFDGFTEKEFEKFEKMLDNITENLSKVTEDK